MNKADLIRVEFAAEKAKEKEITKEKGKLLKDRRKFYFSMSAIAVIAITIAVFAAFAVNGYNPIIYP